MHQFKTMKLKQITHDMMARTGMSFLEGSEGFAVVAVERPGFRGPFGASKDEAFTQWYWRGWAFRL